MPHDGASAAQSAQCNLAGSDAAARQACAEMAVRIPGMNLTMKSAIHRGIGLVGCRVVRTMSEACVPVEIGDRGRPAAGRLRAKSRLAQSPVEIFDMS